MSIELILIQHFFPLNIPLTLNFFTSQSKLCESVLKPVSAYFRHSLHFIKHCLILATERWVRSHNVAFCELRFYIVK